MSSAPTRSEDTGRPGERERVNEQDLPENKDAVSMELLKKENGNLKHTADIQAGKILRLEMELHETKQARIDDSVCAGKSKLEIALDQAKAEVESMRLSQETRQRNILELVEKHNYRITIPVASHAQVIEHFQALIPSGNKEHINHLLEFVFFAKVGKWCCLQEACEKGAIGLTEARTGSECPLHGAECKQIMMARYDAASHHQIIFKRFDPVPSLP
ncbi:hypothetical protein Focb16_v006501 [Fusarium oxysporum f. sp. cubense]|uniref:Uncharacterized protein n=1 Tax=Fusarium oxysporum f. sp. cubense TaxID=61366 RepID=A0A559LNM4_FUSOC|nr:hypothetical protein Focb16_v006501 [Fusarium oxysporum f. sp. cubense]